MSQSQSNQEGNNVGQRNAKYAKNSNEIKLVIYRMWDNGQRIIDIARTLGRNESTIRSIIKKREEAFKQSNESENVQNQHGGARRIKFTQEIKDFITNTLADDCTITLSELRRIILNEFSVNVSESTIYKNLGLLNFSLKRTTIIPIARNSDRIIEQRYEYFDSFTEIQGNYSRNQIIFVDEAGFNISMRRTRGWSQKNASASTTVPGIKTRNYSICAAISGEGPVMYQVRESAYNGSAFEIFLNDLFATLSSSRIENVVLIMDNASIHRCEGVKEAIIASGHKLQLLPPYSPFLNPIEECFSKWKGFVRGLNVNTTDELIAGIETGFSTITNNDCDGWFRHMLYYLNKARRREAIE